MAPRYRRIAELGRGGMAVVYLAAMRAGHGVTKLAVIKELHPELASDPEFRTMFMDEARLAARLNHPNVVQTYDVIENPDGGCSIVMEYLEGQPLSRLRRWLASSEDLLATHLTIHCEMLAGLDYAHHLADFNGEPLHIVHRDVSPHNAFLTYSGEVKIVDFGIAKATSSSAETRMGTIKGKIAYMPPEQARGEHVDARADIFAVGVMLWEAVVGQRLWRGLSDVAIMHKLTSGDIPRPSSVKPVPEALENVIMKALAPAAVDRYASASDLQRDLEAVIRTLPVPPRSRRELGEILATQFAAERTRMQREIEERLRQVVSDTGSFGPQSRLAPIPMAHSESSLDSPLVDEKSSGTSANAARSIEPAAKRNLRLFAISTALTLLLLTVVIVAVSFAGKSSPTASLDGGPIVLNTTPPAVATAPVASARMVKLLLRVTPANATLSIEGVPLAVGASELTDTENTRRILHVEAPGYEPQDVPIVFTLNATVEIALKKRAPNWVPPPNNGKKPPPPPSTSVTTPPPPATTTKPPTSSDPIGW